MKYEQGIIPAFFCSLQPFWEPSRESKAGCLLNCIENGL